VFSPKKYYAFNFWYPIFPCGYRRFCSSWWAHWFTPWIYKQFFKTKWQRMARGYADSDTWNLNDYAADVIYHALLHFKKSTHGHPCDLTEESWNDILDKMINGFAAKLQLLDDLTYGEHCWVKQSDRDLVGEFDPELYEAWRSPLEAQWAEGSALFVKHFDSLWD